MSRPNVSTRFEPEWMRQERSGEDAVATVRAFFTALVMVPAILLFLAQGLLIKCLTRDPVRRLRRLTENVTRYSRFALKVMRIEALGFGRETSRENDLIVCNHMSYLDLLVIASISPCVFVTSIDMGEKFFLGTMAEIGGSIFIERRNRDRIERDITQIAETLDRGFNVVLFPEGTSSNGESVLPFKRSLLLAAGRAGKRILPATLKYVRIDGQPFGKRNRDLVCWYGAMSFLPHFLKLMSVQSVLATVDFHLPITPREADCKETLAKWTHKIISTSYQQEAQA